MRVIAIVRGLSGLHFTRQFEVNAQTVDEAENKIRQHLKADEEGWNDKLLAIELPSPHAAERIN